MSTGTSENHESDTIYIQGGPKILVYQDVLRPTTGQGEVLIRVYAAA